MSNKKFMCILRNPGGGCEKPSPQDQSRGTAALEGRVSEQGKRLDTLSAGVSAVQETAATERGENQVGEMMKRTSQLPLDPVEQCPSIWY